MTSFSLSEIHNENLQADVRTPRNMKVLCIYTDRLQRSPEIHSVGSGAAGSIFCAIHTHTNIVHDLLHVRLTFWTTFRVVNMNMVMDTNIEEWAALDRQEKPIAEIGPRYHDLCVTICTLLMAQHDETISVAAQNEEGKCQYLLV